MRFGYACGALRVTTDERSESTGPRAHVVGFLSGLRAAGVEPRVYLAGDHVPASVAGSGSASRIDATPARRLATDATRIGLRYELRRRARAAIGPVDILYERQATFQDIGRAFRARGSRWIIESNGPFWYEAATERKSLALVRLARKLELDAYRDADLVVAVSDELKEIIVRESGRSEKDVFVLPNATDAIRFDPATVTPRRLAEGPTIGFAGYMTRWAGIDSLIWAAAALRDSEPPVDLVLIGDGPERGALERQASEEGVAERVHFTGNVPWSEVPALLAGVDVAYSGQRSMQIGAMYHSPQKLYEYQAMALPIVASDHADARRLLSETASGWLFDPEDRDDLLFELRAALADSERLERGRRAREALLAEHTWEVRTRELLEELTRRSLLPEHSSTDPSRPTGAHDPAPAAPGREVPVSPIDRGGSALTVSEGLRALRRRWWLVLICLIVGGGAGYGLSRSETKRYKAEATVYVTSRLTSQLAEQQVKSYANIATSSPVLRRVDASLNLAYGYRSLRGNVSVTVPAETTLIDLSVTERKAARAAEVANSIASVLAQTVEQLQRPTRLSKSTVSVTTVQPADVPVSPSTPRTKLNVIIGLIVGAAVSLALALSRRERSTA